jgi:hypothetical protein
LGEASHEAALDQALGNAASKIKRPSEDRHSLITMASILDKSTPQSHDETRKALGSTHTAQDAARFPEIVLAIMLYQAAHFTYLSQLQTAVDRSKILSPDEKDNVSAVLKGDAFNQFNIFIIYETFLPLVLIARRDLESKFPTMADDELTRTATGNAWDSFFEKKILRTDFDEKIVPLKEKGQPASMICPAHNHLHAAKERGTLEDIFDFIIVHKQELEPWLKETEKAATYGLRGLKPVKIPSLLQSISDRFQNGSERSV